MLRVRAADQWFRWSALLLAALVTAGLPVGRSEAADTGQPVGLSPWLSPSAAFSTSGDFATDTFGDPWDFQNQEDLIAIDEVGTQATTGVSISGGMLNANTQNGSTIRLLFNWPRVLPWGRDGWANPIDAGLYTQTTFRICASVAGLDMGVRFENAYGQQGTLPFNPPAGCSTQHFDLTYQGPVPGRTLQYPFPGQQGPWTGPVVRFEVFRGGGPSGSQLVQLDWVRLHRSDAPQEPPAGVPVPQVLTPNVEGGEDYALSQRGNAWDFTSGDDLGERGGLANIGFSPGGMTATTIGNDPFVGLPLGPEVNTDRYHRLTVDSCQSGGFSLADSVGGGMNGRLLWMPLGSGSWTETQDFVVFPGCHRMTIDLATNPGGAVQDEDSTIVTGWKGMRPIALRYDPNEDRGNRSFTLSEVKLADDAAFSNIYDVSFLERAGVGGTADIYVTTQRGRFDGTRIGGGIQVQGGLNTFRWDGTTATGASMPNGTYWVYVVVNNNGKVGTATSTGPVRLEKPVPATPSWYVPLAPARILDTRTGIGGNIVPLGPQVFTELDVTGVGGVPDTGVTAVVMNVTVDQPWTDGYLTVWPSGEGRPLVSNLNFAPGQTVPNMATVKVGANGRVNVFNSKGVTSVVADVVGYYSSTPVAGGLFTPLTPGRVLDSRDGTGRGGVVAPVAQGQHIDVRVTGTRGVPESGVSAVALNVTVDGPTAAGFITTWPTGERMPDASTHNFTPGLTVANLVIAKVGAGGMVSMFNSAGSTHLVADVVGYFSSSGGAFVPVTPRRLADTRDGTGGVFGQVGPQSSVSVTVADGNPVPANASGAVVNVTSVSSSEASFLTVWPSGPGRPVASTLNPRPGVPVPNQAYLKLGDAGRLVIYNNTGSTDVFVDVFGYVL
jgi:hypothetical protein